MQKEPLPSLGSGNSLPSDRGQMVSPRKVDAKFQQSIVEYLKLFPHLNFSKDNISHKNAELIEYLIKQEDDLTSQAQLLGDKPLLQDQKIEHLTVVAQLRQALKQQQQSSNLKSTLQLPQGIVDSIQYEQSDGFSVKLHFIEKIPHEIENIAIEYGLFRRGDNIKTFRETQKIPTIALNWKFNKCILNYQEIFRHIYPTVNTFIYLDIKAFPKNIAPLLTLKSQNNQRAGAGHFIQCLMTRKDWSQVDLNYLFTPKIISLMPYLIQDFLLLVIVLFTQKCSHLQYEDYIIPPLHLKEKNVEQIEEDLLIAGFVDEHIKKKGVIKSTFKDEELQMREYNARNKLTLIKQEASISGWKSEDITIPKNPQPETKSYLSVGPQLNKENDIFAQINQRIEDQKLPKPKQQEPKLDKYIVNNIIQEEEKDYTQKGETSLYQLSESQFQAKKKKEKSHDADNLSSMSGITISKVQISKTMKQILEKRQKSQQQHIYYFRGKYCCSFLDKLAQAIKSKNPRVQLTFFHKYFDRILHKAGATSLFRPIWQKNDIIRRDEQDPDQDLTEQQDTEQIDNSFEREMKSHMREDDSEVNQTVSVMNKTITQANKTVTQKKDTKVNIRFSIKAMKNWKQAPITYEVSIINEKEQVVGSTDSNQLQVIQCEKKRAIFNNIESSLVAQESENQAQLLIKIREIGSTAVMGECIIKLLQEGMWISKVIEASLYKIDKKKTVDTKQQLEIEIDINQINPQEQNNYQQTLQIVLLQLISGSQIKNDLMIKVSIQNGSDILFDSRQLPCEQQLQCNYTQDTKNKSIILFNNTSLLFQFNSSSFQKQNTHKIMLFISFFSSNKGKFEELGWTFLKLFDESGQEKQGEQNNIQLFKFPVVKDIHLQDIKKLKTIKNTLSIRLDPISEE